jgi:hypothetical protein
MGARPLPFRLRSANGPHCPHRKACALSDESADKLAVALIYLVGKWKRRDDPTYAPFYYDECWAWFQRLSAEDQDLVLTLADVMASAHKNSAEKIAAALPPAPRCPL